MSTPAETSFWPPGWDRERLLNASSDELLSLTDDQRSTMFDGIRSTLGEQGLRETRQEMSKRYHARLAAADAATSGASDAAGSLDQTGQQPDREAPAVTMTDDEKRLAQELQAPYVHVLDRVFRGLPEWEDWGFVVFRTTSYPPRQSSSSTAASTDQDQEQNRWNAFRSRWDEIIEDIVGPHRGTSDRVDDAIRRIKFHWVEDPSLQDATPVEIARRYQELAPRLPRGLNNSVCLSITSASLTSVLESPLPSSGPRTRRGKIPFAVAVAESLAERQTDQQEQREHDVEDEDIAGQDFPGYFNVAVESLLSELFPIVALDITDLHTLTVKMTDLDRDIWCAHDRWGVHRGA